jgi:hypothetical protein
MLKLVSENNVIVFDSHHESSNTDFSIVDNTRYSLYITNKYFYGDVKVSIYKNDVLCKEVCVQDQKCACLTFKTGVGDDIFIRTYEKCETCVLPNETLGTLGLFAPTGNVTNLPI